SSAATLSIEVRAAPWIPVEEIRIFVNGKQVMTIPVWEDFRGADHLASRILRSTPAPIPLSELLGDARDAWLVVEAGMKQETPDDMDYDGLPDLPESDGVGR